MRTIKEVLVGFGSFALTFFALAILTPIDFIEVFFVATMLSAIISLPILMEMEEK